MKRRWWVFLFLLMIAAPVAAQSNCHAGLPCGPVPWRLPVLPQLASPTPFPTAVITTTPTNTPAPTVTGTPPTATPAPTSTAQFDIGSINDQVGTLQVVMNGTPVATLAVERFGEHELGDNAGTFFGYVLGLSEVNFGVLTPLFILVIFGMIYRMGWRLALLILPALTALFGVFRKVVSLILDFLPF